MNKISYIITLLFCSIISFGQQNPNKVVGIYWTPKKDGKIEITTRNNLFFGKVLEGKNPRKDTLNPNPALRSKQVIGMEIMKNFKFNKNNNEYIDGEIYDPESGKTYSCKMWMENENLKIRGFLGISLLGRTEFFEKVK